MRKPAAPALLALVFAAGCAADAPFGPLEHDSRIEVPVGALHIASDTIRPGADIVIDGAGFSTTPGANEVLIGDQRATVVRATGTRLVVRLPHDACVGTGVVPVHVTASGQTSRTEHPMRAARRLELPAGGAELVLEAGALRCLELAGGSHYLVSVFNTSTSPSALSEFTLRGRAGLLAGVSAARVARDAHSTAQVHANPRHPGGRDAPTMGGLDVIPDSVRRAAELHRRVLEISRIALADAAPASAPARPRTVTGELARGVEGEVLALKVPDLNTGNACASPRHVRARTVYAGRRGIVLEDLANAMAGRMDDQLRAIGRELDDVMWPIITGNFGDPLAMDARLDANGRILMLFSREVNRFVNIAGFVIGCDFVDPSRNSRYAASNMAEIFYAREPGAGEGAENWRRTMRSTVIHEVKHITSFAERLSRGGRFEDSWLEESTARHAEELFARTFSGAQWRGNTRYAGSIHCEVRPADAACGGRPQGMVRHFDAVARYLEGVETHTPLGGSTGSDFTFYGSGWAFTRWIIDQYASSEAAFLRALTRDAQVTGIANLERQTGRSFAEMLGWWSLAMALDDRPGFTPRHQELRFPSWQLRDVFAGMQRDLGRGRTWNSGYPLSPRHVSFGSFAVDVPVLRGGTAAVFEISGATTASQLLELAGRNGSAPPATLRVGVARIE